MSPTQSLSAGSPAFSVSSIVRPQESTFAGESLAPFRRLLTHNLPGPSPIPSAFQNPMVTSHLLQSEMANNTTNSAHYQYRQTDEERLRQELSQRERLHGTTHPDILEALLKLGALLVDQGRYRSAEDMTRKSIQGLQIAGGENSNVEVLDALEQLAEVLYHQGCYSKTENLSRRVFQSRRDSLGVEDLTTHECFLNVGSRLISQGKYAEAEAMHRRALQSYQ